MMSEDNKFEGTLKLAYDDYKMLVVDVKRSIAESIKQHLIVATGVLSAQWVMNFSKATGNSIASLGLNSVAIVYIFAATILAGFDFCLCLWLLTKCGNFDQPTKSYAGIAKLIHEQGNTFEAYAFMLYSIDKCSNAYSLEVTKVGKTIRFSAYILIASVVSSGIALIFSFA